ncbi:MAG: DNA polymerase Y family protein [Rhodocyclaceae bacterium]|nr:DNA polymerase Y family protein [Rhodocyclaceae bacterium]
MLWIALFLPDLPLQAYTRGGDDPGLLAVVAAAPRPHVVAATAAARACGVEAGLRVAGALAVAPDLELKPRERRLEQETLEHLANWAGRFTPFVSVAADDAVVLEVSRCLRLAGGLTTLVHALQEGVAGLGLTVQLAAAPTPLAACWLARTRPGTLVSAREGWQRCLEPLPVELLAAEESTTNPDLDLLRGIGIHTLGALARLPRDGLARRQGTRLLEALARARGERPDPRLWYEPPERFEAHLALPAAVSTVEPLLFATRRLIAGLAGWLARRHGAIDRLCLELEHERRPSAVVPIATGQPCRDEERLLLLAREHLAVLPLTAPVIGLQLTADSVVTQAGRTQDLFGDAQQARDAGTLLIARLRVRLGPDAVRSLDCRPEHRPELAWCAAEPQSRPEPAVGQAPRQARRPLWLLAEPRALPSLDDLTPVSGPERIESGWWDARDVQRDYYVARNRDAALWWIFRRLDAPGGWYLHGYFG